ncbi:MAG: inorganic phosphate transporter family protein [Desulfohalobiaceae bacterium]|nr:inorganic phosphate transporter family protein [Desulfohalobiaceae bacterium]
MFLFFLSSGLFLGWSLGANDAANVFGTAVGSQMIKFKTAAVLCSIFIILGAVISGAGATHTLGKLGAVNALPGAFMVALSAALTVYLMTLFGYPVSTSQAIVGAILGWNFFSGSLTDYQSLVKIVLTWVACPVLAALFAIVLYKLIGWIILHLKVHMLIQDAATRYCLVLAGTFGAFSLGANNIANVMGVFVPVSPFADINIFGLFSLSAAQQLFFLGGIAIAVGVFTYSKRVMLTVGAGIFRLSPLAAFVVVMAHSLVLFLFASERLANFLVSHGLPSLPLVPVSSSQAVVGGVVGIGLLKRGRGLRWQVLGGISTGWVSTPVIACLVCFVSLFFLQNVFEQQTYKPVPYKLTTVAMDRIKAESPAAARALQPITGKRYETAARFRSALHGIKDFPPEIENLIIDSAELYFLRVKEEVVADLDRQWFSTEQINALKKLEKTVYIHKWRLTQALSELSPAWRFKDKEVSALNNDLKNKLEYLYNRFHINKPDRES